MIQPETSLILAVFAVLLLASTGYNELVAWLERRGYIEGYVSLAVVAGVLFTLGGVAIINWQAALLALGAFTATGTPMVIGSIWRYIRVRREEQEHERQAARMAQSSQSREGSGG